MQPIEQATQSEKDFEEDSKKDLEEDLVENPKKSLIEDTDDIPSETIRKTLRAVLDSPSISFDYVLDAPTISSSYVPNAPNVSPSYIPEAPTMSTNSDDGSSSVNQPQDVRELITTTQLGLDSIVML